MGNLLQIYVLWDIMAPEDFLLGVESEWYANDTVWVAKEGCDVAVDDSLL